MGNPVHRKPQTKYGNSCNVTYDYNTRNANYVGIRTRPSRITPTLSTTNSYIIASYLNGKTQHSLKTDSNYLYTS